MFWVSLTSHWRGVTQCGPAGLLLWKEEKWKESVKHLAMLEAVKMVQALQWFSNVALCVLYVSISYQLGIQVWQVVILKILACWFGDTHGYCSNNKWSSVLCKKYIMQCDCILHIQQWGHSKIDYLAVELEACRLLPAARWLCSLLFHCKDFTFSGDKKKQTFFFLVHAFLINDHGQR